MLGTEEMMAYLKEEFGIKSMKEFEEAFKNQKRIRIGVFADEITKPKGKEVMNKCASCV